MTENPGWKRPVHNCQSQYIKALTVVDFFGNLTFYNIMMELLYMYTRTKVLGKPKYKKSKIYWIWKYMYQRLWVRHIIKPLTESSEGTTCIFRLRFNKRAIPTQSNMIGEMSKSKVHLTSSLYLISFARG